MFKFHVFLCKTSFGCVLSPPPYLQSVPFEVTVLLKVNSKLPYCLTPSESIFLALNSLVISVFFVVDTSVTHSLNVLSKFSLVFLPRLTVLLTSVQVYCILYDI